MRTTRTRQDTPVSGGGSVRAAVHAVAAPYRLDLTVAVLRRFSTNVVDVVAADGTYLRAHASAGGPAIVAVRQIGPSELEVRIEGNAATRERALAVVRRTLGTERTTPHFARGAKRLDWLRALAERMRGVRPPRYATLWEACVNAIVFQQVSLLAASAILGRVIRQLGTALAYDGIVVHAFPTPDILLAASDDALRTAGLSAAKIATLRRVATALETDALQESVLEALPSADAAALLCEIKGIGPWTAAVILLRGLGRLDVFPENDSGVAKGLLALTGRRIDVAQALAELAPEQGMLYYHLLLARLEALGALPVALFGGGPA